MLFTLAYCLAFAFPIAFVAHNVLQVLIGIDVFTAQDVYKRQYPVSSIWIKGCYSAY